MTLSQEHTTKRWFARFVAKHIHKYMYIYSSVWRYHMPTRFGIADHEIGRLSQQRVVQRYKFIQIGRPGLAATAQTVLAWPAIYEKTPVQSGANLTVYIRTISERVDLTCILYIF